MVPSFAIASIAVGIFLPWLLYNAVFENCKVKNGKVISKFPKVFRIGFILGVLLFLFLTLMCYLTEDVDIGLIFLYIAELLVALFFFALAYLFNRYKIVMDINNKTFLVYRFFKIKKKFNFSEIYKIEYGKDKEIGRVLDKNNNLLFYNIMLMNGWSCIQACLNTIINNNRNNEPYNMEKLERLLNNYKELHKLK